MNEYRKQTEEAASKVILNVDNRLRNFFDVEDDENTGPIYSELKEIDRRYKDFEEVGSGGMKRIFSVFDKNTDRRVALAQLHDESTDEFYETFLREARLTARLDHPNIIKIHDIGIDESEKPYFTMDLKTGLDLDGVLKKGTTQLRELLVIFIKICDAISYAHSKGVLHLDLKPENIQIGEFGEVLICDWGLGKVIDDDSFTEDHATGGDLLNDMTLHGRIKGTPGFMAPEQVTGEDKSVHTDIYSLGAILYNLLTVEKPITGTVEEILKKTAHGKLIKPSERSPDVNIPSSLEAVVLKAMQLEKEDRYQTVGELLKDIRSYVSGFATMAENAGVLKLASLMFKRNKGIFAVLIIALIVLAVSISLFINRVQNERAIAIEERDRANVLSQSEKEARTLAESNAQLLHQEKAELKSLNEKYIGELTLQSIFVTDNINHWDVYDEKIYTNTLSNLE